MKIIQIWALSILLLTMSSVQANRQLAVRNGCMGCHADAASLQGEKLRKGKLFNHIKAHSKLSPANARDLMQWIIDGAQ